MFRLHETTRRQLGRTLFVLGALLPTAALVCWAISLRTAGHREHWQQQLGERLGGKIRCVAVTHPWSDTVRLHDVVWQVTESGEELACWPTVDWVQTPTETRLSLPSAELSPRGRLFLQARASAPLAATDAPALRIACGTLYLTDEARRTRAVLYQVLLRTSVTGEGNQAQLLAKTDPNDSVAAELLLTRRRVSADLTQPRPTIVAGGELRTGGRPLSGIVWALGAWPAWLRETDFNGTARWLEAADGVQAHLTGELRRVDLQAAVGDALSQRWTGAASLRFDSLQLVSGRLTHWSGSLSAGPGEIARELLLGLQTLGCKTLRPPSELPPVIQPYDQLSTRVEWSPEQLLLRGECPDQPTGTLFAYQGAGILAEAPAGLGSPSQLLNALAPLQTPRVPALPGIANWLRWMPGTASPSPIIARPVESTARHW